jgi:cytochrome c peroxidase
LSNDRTVSCATCHDPERAFADTKALAVGISGRVGKRHSPSLINRAFGRSHFWDGRAGSLEAQVVQPISDRNEMDLPIEDAVARLAGDRAYRDAFQSVFGQPVSGADLGRALATYLRTIRSTDSPYDRFMAGATDAMTPEQQQGLQIFRAKARCIFCHVEPLFTDEQFQNTGVAWQADTTSYKDDGRFMVSSQQRDRGKFKTPTLREIARTAPYMHDGSLPSLADVVDFYDTGGASQSESVSADSSDRPHTSREETAHRVSRSPQRPGHRQVILICAQGFGGIHRGGRLAGQTPATSPTTVSNASAVSAVTGEITGRAPTGTDGIRIAILVSAQATAIPTVPPDNVIASASNRNPTKIARLVAPTARRVPISARPLAHGHEQYIGHAHGADEQARCRRRGRPPS